MILKRGPSFYASRRFLLKLGLLITGCFVFSIWQKDALLVAVLAEPVKVEQAAYFFDNQAEISLTTPLRGQIRYTTDGSEPVSGSSVYSNSLIVTEPIVLRYAVFHENQRKTPVFSKDIFVDISHTVPVISLVTNPDNLWDPETGIYVEGQHENYLEEGEEWERPAELKLYGTDGSLELQQAAGIRLHGNAMRLKPQKGFRIYAKDEDGRDSRFRYPFFGETGNREYASLILRNGGDPKTFLRDRLANRIATEHSSVLAQKSKPVVLYLNGRYWGLYYLYERFDETYFSERFRFKPASLSIIEIPLASDDTRGQAVPATKNSTADAEQFNKLSREVRSCGSCGSFGTMSEYFDMDVFIDYYIFELFFANFDWPYNNAKLWRYGTDEYSPEPDAVAELDGRFRWLLFDLDAGFGGVYDTEEAMAAGAGSNTYTKLVDDAFPFRNLFNNRLFRERYINRLEELLETGLSAEYMDQTVQELAAEIRLEMPRTIERWSAETVAAGHEAVQTMEEWEHTVELLRLYVQKRPEGFYARTLEYFEL